MSTKKETDKSKETLNFAVSENAEKMYEEGKALRKKISRSAQSQFKIEKDRTEGIKLVQSQEKGRVPELIPIRYERMGTSAFAFYRGCAIIMASDLSKTNNTGLNVQACGDAHISNFGAFASPERKMVFDINDFDETSSAPWEWDLKRLAASIVICGRDRGFDSKSSRNAVLSAINKYRETMFKFAHKTTLDTWYAHLNVADALKDMEKQISKKQGKEIKKTLSKAYNKNSTKAISKFTEISDGKLRMISDPPFIVPIHDLMPEANAEQFETMLGTLIAKYKESLSDDRKNLIDRYSFVDCGRKVVGVGSVGTRAWIVLLKGRDENDPLVLQIKEAQSSVLEPYAGVSKYTNHGQRVVEGQRLMQASSDICLGWVRSSSLHGKQCDYYIRQLWDWKSSTDLTVIDEASLKSLSSMCGWTLARAHARTGNRFKLAGYLGEDNKFDKAIADFAEAYAEQNEADYNTFMNSLDGGKLKI